MPDAGDMLHKKYKPLNAGYRPGMRVKMKDNAHTNSIVLSDIPKPPVVLYPEDRVENEWKDMRRVGPGLANLGNTCFLNSVLQVLTYTPPLVNYVLLENHKGKCKSIAYCILAVPCQNSVQICLRKKLFHMLPLNKSFWSFVQSQHMERFFQNKFGRNFDMAS